VTATVTACEGDDFDVEINFEYQDVTNQFTVVGNGVSYGTFEYTDLPITLLTLNADCVTEYEFVVTDAENNDCSDFVELGPVCCEGECMMSELVISASECDGGFFDVTIDFDYSNTSDSFNYDLIDVLEGTADYSDLPITLNVSSNLSGFGITIIDTEDNTCGLETFLDNPCAEDPCVIGQIETTVDDCMSGYFNVTLSFAHENNSDQFSVVGNGQNYGQFFYSDLPITIPELLGDCETEYEFIVTDVEYNDCSNFTSIDPVCCDMTECEFSELLLDPSDCDNGSFDLVIDFNYSGNTNEFFDLFIYDQLNEVVFEDYVSFTELPLTISISNTESQYFVVSIFENDNQTCNIDGDFTNPCFEDGECFIYSIDFGDNPYCENGYIETEWYIFGENTSEVGYDIFINNEFIAFVQYNGTGPYNFDIEAPNTEYFTIKACDNDNDNCCYTWELMNPCFEEESCFIGEITATTSDCNNDNQFSVTLDFEYDNTSDQFSVVGNGVDYGLFSYSNLPIIIDGLLGDCATEYEFIVSDVNNNDCTNFTGIDPVCCEEDCELWDLLLESGECNGGTFELTIDFEYSGTTNDFYDYIVYDQLNEIVAQGFAPFAQLPLVLSISNTDSEYFVVSIFENDNDGCFITGDLINPCYEESGDCFISEITVTQSDCNEEGLFSVTLNFEYENTSDQFTVNGNGNSYGTFSYSDLPITINELEGNCDTNYEFVVHDVNNNDCASDIDYGVVCCEEDDCELWDLLLESGECEDGGILLSIDFEYSGTTNEFFDYIIYDQMNEIIAQGTSPFDQLPFSIEIANTESQYFVVSIFENDNDGCFITGEYENPCYEESGDCFISEITVTQSDCNEEGFFSVTLDFEYDNTSDQFTVNGNGNSYGTFSYSDLPITINELEGNCDTNYEFVVHDVNNSDCASDIDYGVVCCGEDNCEMTTLDFGDNPACENGFIVTEWLIDGENISEVGYDIFINGEFQLFVEYEEDSWYDFDIIAPETANFTMTVCDNDNEACCITWELDNPCYENQEDCELWDLNLDSGECTEGGFELTIDFEYSGTTNDFYDYVIYDQMDEVIAQGNAPFAQLPLTIIIVNSESEYFIVSIFENDNDGCFVTGEIENPCFEPPVGDCYIDDVTAIVTACEGNVFDVQIDFESDYTSDQFIVNGNGNSYGTFSYADLPIVLTGLEADCATEFEFVIHDVNDNDCTAGVDYGPVCCEDFNNILEIIITDFIDEDFINIDVNVIISLLNGCDLEVYMNGDLYTVLTMESTNFDIGPFECNTDQVVVLTFVNTCTNESLDFEIDISDIDCTTSVESFDIADIVLWSQTQKQLLINQAIDGNYSLQVLSIDGRLVSQNSKIKQGQVIDLNNLHSGLYITRLIDEDNGKIGLMKILVY
jgi:hypothetical protein